MERAYNALFFTWKRSVLKHVLLALLLVSCTMPAPRTREGQSPTQRGVLPAQLTAAAQTIAALTPSAPAPAGGPEAAAPTEPAAATQVVPSEAGNAPGAPAHLVGVEVHHITSQALDQLNALGVSLVRRNALVWPYVEPVEGERNWGAVAELEEGLQLLGSRGFETILIVRGTPEWAQRPPGSLCGAIRRGKFEAFASFVAEAVTRYSQPPYNVRYWELGNEPDVDPSLVAPTFPFGCWGDQQDEYYGGGHYAEMLKIVYPAIKAANPQAQVLIGGLLLDCDPDNPPEGKDCKPARFLEGILQAGGGAFFDIVSFHGYPTYTGSLEMDERNPSWVNRGGTVLGRVDYLRQVMAAYGLNKPLMHTESSLNCPEWNTEGCNPPGEPFFELQADYAVILYVRNWAEGLAATVWYQYEGPGWRYTGLFDDTGAPTPAYRAMQFLNQELDDARYVSPVSEYPDTRGYAFSNAGKTIWVLWSPDTQPDPVLLPQGVTQVLDKYGNPIALEGGSLEVLSPVYVEFSP